MTHDPHAHDPHAGPSHDQHAAPPHSHEPAPEPSTGLTGFALVKYGFILLIVIVVLWFVGTYILGR